MFHKIIVASDGSENARDAAVSASEIAKHFDSEIVVVNGFDLSFATSGEIGVWGVPIDEVTIEACMQGERAAAESAVKPILESMERPYRMIQELGHPVDAILDVAEREKADLIVVGSRGLSRLKEIFLGSVSHGILHHAHCPVLIERGTVPTFQRILLTSDGSSDAQQAAEAAFTLAKGFGACLTVLNVNEPPGRFRSGTVEPHPVKTPEEKEDSERRYKAAEAVLHEPAQATGVSYRHCQETGHPGQTIVRYADAGEYDLIVMGSRGLGGFERLLLGSVSHYVAYHAHCSLLVVR